MVVQEILQQNNLETHESKVICPITDCTHANASCPAFLGLNGQYALYRSFFYAMTGKLTNELEWHHKVFKRREPLDTEWEILWEHAFPERAGANVNIRLSGGYAVIHVNETGLLEETDEEIITLSKLVSINLHTNVVTVSYFDLTHRASYILLGVADGKAIM